MGKRTAAKLYEIEKYNGSIQPKNSKQSVYISLLND